MSAKSIGRKYILNEPVPYCPYCRERIVEEPHYKYCNRCMTRIKKEIAKCWKQFNGGK